MDSSVLLSIVTPAYNRAHLLERCFASLLTQTDKRFQWVIVDDGSVDNTRELVNTFHTDAFEIIYVHKENGGKHTALNAAHPYINGRYVLILDSDDFLTPNAVERISECWEVWKKKQNVGILTFLRGRTLDDPLCTGKVANKPVNILRSKRNIIHGNDCCEVIRAELFKELPFPVFPGERFLSECALWNRVALKYQCVYINEIIYICEYLDDGLTQAGRGLRIRNPHGGMFTSELKMGKNNYFLQRIKSGLLYCCYGFFAGLSAVQIVLATKDKVIATVCLLPGWILYLHWRSQYEK